MVPWPIAQRHQSKAVRASRKVHFTGTPSLPGDTTSAASRCLSPQSQPQQPPETAAVAQGYQGEGPGRRETIISARARLHKQLSRRLTASGRRCTKQLFAVRRMRRRAQRKLWEDAGREACAQRHGLRQTPRQQRWDTQTMQPRRQEPQLAGEGIRVASTGVDAVLQLSGLQYGDAAALVRIRSCNDSISGKMTPVCWQTGKSQLAGISPTCCIV